MGILMAPSPFSLLISTNISLSPQRLLPSLTSLFDFSSIPQPNSLKPLPNLSSLHSLQIYRFVFTKNCSKWLNLQGEHRSGRSPPPPPLPRPPPLLLAVQPPGAVSPPLSPPMPLLKLWPQIPLSPLHEFPPTSPI